MSDFLSRLVQRTRGEAATVRPVSHTAIAPDPGGAAWDEQVAIREAPPLARLPGAALPAPDLHPGLERAGEMRAAPIVAARPGQLEITEALELEPADAMPPIAATSVPQRARGAFGAQQDGRVPDSARTTVASVTAAQPPAPPSPTPPLAPTPARGAQASEPVTARARTRSTAAAPPGSTPTAFASSLPRTPELALERSRRVTPQPATSDLAVAMNVPVPSVPSASPLRAALRGDADAQGPRRLTARAPGAAAHEHNTTVEVSIGRIEVRLPPRPRVDGDAPSLTPRRAAVGLAEYLNSRDSGKSR